MISNEEKELLEEEVEKEEPQEEELQTEEPQEESVEEDQTEESVEQEAEEETSEEPTIEEPVIEEPEFEQGEQDNQEPEDEDDIQTRLLKETIAAQRKEAAQKERERVNTRLCYERALAQFYEEEGIDPDEEQKAKLAEEQHQLELDNMSYPQEVKYRFNQLRSDLQNPVRKKIRYANFGKIILSIFRGIILFGLCFVIFMPIIEKLSYALRSPMDINNPQVVWIPETWSLLNVSISYNLLTKEGNSYFNTILLSFIAMIIQVFATAIPGYAFARLKFKGSELIFYLVIASLAIPNEALKVARSLFFNNYGFFGYNLVGSVLSIYIMTLFGMGTRSAIFIFLFRQAFRNLPIELEESAEVDGAGVIRTFTSVMFPNVRGTVITVGLFAFVWQYNDYYFASLFSYQRTMPLLSTALVGATETLNSVIGTQYPQLAQEMGSVISDEFYELITSTSALLMMLPILIAYLFVQKLFVQSVERSGLTGM